ncbi:probable disease resistance protein At1g58602 [Salvia splendens]|uniref:probable disease resistance protein At1g58602 n=1 Tax=Salvia splendens TaxID=180675 RepID=UPI001C26DFC6|nr:probable disease resistance protein At1g58602 [Salvia splendens]
MAVEAAVSFAVETLGNFLIEKAVFLKGVEGDVEWLRNELKRMQCFQKDAARKQSKSESIRNWISEIREVAHDAADTIEMFVLNVESRAQQQGRSDCCFQYPDRVYHLNRVGKEIESIRKRLKDIEDGRVRYGIQDDDHGRDSGTSIQVESWRRLAYWQKDTDVVGLEEDVEELVEKLLGISIMEKKKNVEVARKREEEINRKREEMIRRRSEERKLEEEEDKERKREDEEEERKLEEEEEERKREEEREVEEEKRVVAARKKRKDEINMKREDRLRRRKLERERKSEEERKREKEEEDEERKREDEEEERKLEEEMEERKREKERKVEEEKRVEAARKKRKDEINMKREDRLRRRKLEQERKREEERKMEEEDRKRDEEQRKREEERKGHSVAAIEGMGGIGKSTLASRIYNHPAVADRFESRAWVVVSSEFMLEDIIQQIMHQLDIWLYIPKLHDELRRQDILLEQLHEELKGKLYFVVLDDLWDVQHFESLRRAFPQDKASRLILTSRNKGMRYSTDYVHEMKLLDDNRSWKLFLRKAFIANSGGKCPEELKDIGEEILTKCQGLPLAISVVGGLLLRKTPCRSEWLKVRDEMRSQLDGNRGDSESDIKTISAILELSYKHLLPELKVCFLCLGFFKEDAMIKVKNLVHIWVAQGLVPQREVGVGETMEDVARIYLGELISRNMVQVKESTHDQVKACKMHDLIRDLCLRKAKEEIDFEVLSEEGNSRHSSSRHRAVYSTRLSLLNSTRNQHVRSLFIHGETERNNDWQSYWKSFELLRVLDLGNIRFQIWPKAIGGLVGLRYLKMIYDGKDSSLPRSWAKLKNLQVLHLGCGFGLFITDKVILEMDSLRHLYAYISSHSKVPLGNLRNLQTLCFFVVEDSNLWQVKAMTGVTKLGIDMREISDARNIFMNLAELENLVNLTLLYHVSKNLDGLDTLQRVTQLKLVTMSLPRNFPPNLSHLTLSRMRLGKDPMPVLEKLPKLLYLKLCDNYIGEEMVVSHCGFPRLKVMVLQDNVRVKNVMVEEGAMPELKQLMIRNCKRLIIDNLPEHLKSKIIVAD